MGLTYAAGTPYADTDHDGMADAWESANNLDLEDPTDGTSTSLGQAHYTNLEAFLDGLAESATRIRRGGEYDINPAHFALRDHGPASIEMYNLRGTLERRLGGGRPPRRNTASRSSGIRIIRAWIGGTAVTWKTALLRDGGR